MENNGHEERKLSKSASRVIIIAGVIIIIAALKAASSILVPLAFAIFLVAVFWPLQRRFMKKISKGLSTGLSLLILLGFIGALIGAMVFSVDLVQDKWPKYEDKFNTVEKDLRDFAQKYDVNLPGTRDSLEQQNQGQARPQETGGGAGGRVISVLGKVFSTAGAFFLMLAYFGLGLLEVPSFQRKFNKITGSNASQWVESSHRVAHDFQRYILVRTGVGLLTGTLVFIASLIIGLDFALIWGLINFILNYIPTIGSVLGVIPPVLFAMIQFDGFGMAALTFLVVGGVQIIMGIWIDPLVQGKYLSLSSLVVLISITFWGWVWGIVGALIGVPLTVLIVIAANQHPRSRWIATLLAEDKEGEENKKHKLKN